MTELAVTGSSVVVFGDGGGGGGCGGGQWWQYDHEPVLQLKRDPIVVDVVRMSETAELAGVGQ